MTEARHAGTPSGRSASSPAAGTAERHASSQVASTVVIISDFCGAGHRAWYRSCRVAPPSSPIPPCLRRLPSPWPAGPCSRRIRRPPCCCAWPAAPSSRHRSRWQYKALITLTRCSLPLPPPSPPNPSRHRTGCRHEETQKHHSSGAGAGCGGYNVGLQRCRTETIIT